MMVGVAKKTVSNILMSLLLPIICIECPTIVLFGIFQASLCCSYAKSLEKKSGFDCIQIPGAVKATVPGLPTNSNICGNGVNLPQATTCSEKKLSCLSFLSISLAFSNECLLSE